MASDSRRLVVHEGMDRDSSPTRFVELNGVRLAYSDAGSGPVVLSAHGLTASRKAVAERGLGDFSPLQQRARLIAYDARGHGESTGNPIAEEHTWQRLADDMLALADHVSPGVAVSAIGLSMGTGTLLHAVLRRPERFDRLILTAPSTAWETRAPQARVYRDMAQMVEDSTPLQVEQLFTSAVRAPIFRDLGGYSALPDIPHALLPSVFRGAALSDYPAPEQLRALKQPALILAWDTDPGHPVSTAEKLVALLPEARLHVSTTSDDIRTWPRRVADFLKL